MNHQEQTINHDKYPDESKSRTHRLSKLPEGGDPWALNNLLILEQKKNTSWTPVGQATVDTAQKESRFPKGCIFVKPNIVDFCNKQLQKYM